MARAMGIGLRSRRFSGALIAIMIVTTYGALMEWHQAYIPTRHPSIADGIANGVGACLGVISYILFKRKKRRVSIKEKL